MRLFVAVPVPPHVRDHVEAAVGPARADDRVAWTRPSGWHVTIAFLGEVDDARVPDVVDAVGRGVEAAGVPATIDLATGTVTTLGRGALAVSIDDQPVGALSALGVSVQAAVAAVDLPVTRRPVVGHLTLGRARRRRSVPADLVDRLDVPPASWRAEAVEVVRSVVGSGPATYEVVAALPMA